jgi:hypothetical protein
LPVSKPVNTVLVNWLPWSLLKISGPSSTGWAVAWRESPRVTGAFRGAVRLWC